MYKIISMDNTFEDCLRCPYLDMALLVFWVCITQTALTAHSSSMETNRVGCWPSDCD